MKKLLLIDGHSLAFRSFYAIMNFERFKLPDGTYTNAVYTFNTLLDLLLERFAPTHVLVAFDAGKKTFRTESYPEYKAGRDKTPDEFVMQLPLIKELIEDFGIQWYELPNFEADDIIGTYATKASADFDEVVVVSGDRDLTQLASDKVTVALTKKGVKELELNTPEYMVETYGIGPTQIPDYKGLAGDSSDNIPGVTKVGDKTATKLLMEYGTLENVYEHIDEFKPSKQKENLIADKEIAFMSRDLAIIKCDSPVVPALADFEYTGKNLDALVKFYTRMHFRTFLSKMQVSKEVEIEDPSGQIDLFAAGEEIAEKEKIAFAVVDEIDAARAKYVYLELFEDNYHTAPIKGLVYGDDEEIFVVRDVEKADLSKIKGGVTFEAKKTAIALARVTGELVTFEDDVQLALYIVNSNIKNTQLAYVAPYFEGVNHVAYDDDIYGKGVKRGREVDASKMEQHLADKLAAIRKLKPILEKSLEQNEQTSLYRDIELPFTHILAQMEIEGISVDLAELEALGTEFGGKVSALEAKIYEIAGHEFNVNSPKQLGDVLFDELGLPHGKKTKSGYSTAVEVLEKLADDYEIVNIILEYRQLTKLVSTYVEGLKNVIGADGRIHTRYQQTLTATGRLSSVEPNLQNIPVRMEEGRRIRKAFVPNYPDNFLYSADYSQIELRVLADIADEENMRQAFIDGIDIHQATAAKVFAGGDLAKVTPAMRSNAKAVNFGIVYGISEFGLAKNINVSRETAKNYIETYFTQYPSLRIYMDKVVEEARATGYVETIAHRRRYITDIKNRNFMIRANAERMAINTPIQGSAADILKIAMVELARELSQSGLKAKMLLQVHDEVILEVAENEIAKVDEIVRRVMENCVKLSVPLVADSHWGKNWQEAK
ncbi:MAG: DNA polymerase I [Lactobacillales bacterium]|jgi:DNA polymerase-1|nr:DNA polymerase I [Lactobacillales bacterium]